MGKCGKEKQKYFNVYLSVLQYFQIVLLIMEKDFQKHVC